MTLFSSSSRVPRAESRLLARQAATSSLDRQPTMAVAAAVLLGGLIVSSNLWGEGSGQIGLSQRLLDFTSAQSSGAPDGASASLYVDILSAGEVINVSLCGAAPTDSVSVEIFDDTDTSVYASGSFVSNLACDDDMLAPLSSAVRYTTVSSGVHRLVLENLTGDAFEDSFFERYDISVTPDAVTLPDPSINAGRLWAYSWNFNAIDFDEEYSADTDYYALVPGGRPNSNFIWKLDLNNMSGFGYNIVANSIGVSSPNSGYSVPRGGNDAVYEYPVYIGVPVIADNVPNEPPILTGIRFVDSAGQDQGISPGGTFGIQDTGEFQFTSDVTGTYAIAIDLNRNGIYGDAGDNTLIGPVVIGSNSVVWDGLDAAGDAPPLGNYNARLNVRMGEYHFIGSDIETSGGGDNAADPQDGEGLTIWSTDATDANIPTRVYWDDVTILGESAGGTSNTPDGALSSEAAGRHTWGDFTATGFGNERFIDTYVFGLATATSAQVSIVLDDAPLVGDDGSISIEPETFINQGVIVTVTDDDVNTNPDSADSVIVTVTNTNTGEAEQITLQETGNSTGVFTGSIPSASGTVGISNDGTLNVESGDALSASYVDLLDSGSTQSTVSSASVAVPDFDGDRISDADDPDDDNDQIPDAVETGADLDGDGLPDAMDTDSDGDGIPDAIEAGVDPTMPVDTDGDGTPDYRDLDSDGDTFTDAEEAGDTASTPLDSDGDGIGDYAETDSDGDGLNDTLEGTADTDADGIIDRLDTDADGDGVLDSDEGAADTDGDSLPNYLDDDADGDGIPDAAELGPVPDMPRDTDGDGIADFLETDSDNDGLTDAVEAGDDPTNPQDSDGDGNPDVIDIDSDDDGLSDRDEGYLDTDGDGVPNALDTDSDNDGIGDQAESAENGDLLDSDGDLVPDQLDLDSDNDGLSDIAEDGMPDADNNGQVDDFTDANGDGFDDGVAEENAVSPDSDSDGMPDRLDGDSDGDGVSDLIESGGVDADGNQTLDDFVDVDGDGLSDLLGGVTIVAPDSDGDGTVDVLDLDSDNDGLLDVDEGVMDTDGDRVEDFRDEDSDGDGIPDSVEGDLDSDGDSVPDHRDTDSDNDGIPDVVETAGTGVGTPQMPADTDGDGTPDYLDSDSDGDGIDDVVEGAGNADGDAVPNYIDIDSDGDGISDAVEGAGNLDGDDLPNFLDLDADGDGTTDRNEGQSDIDGDGTPDALDPDTVGNAGADSDGDGLPDAVEGDVDTDGDGINDSQDGDSDNDGIPDRIELLGSLGVAGETVLVPADSDGDGVPDYRDLDSDNDGLSDALEVSISDEDGDGRVDGFVDMNGNGVDDGVDALAVVGLDSDGDGVPDYRDLDSDNDGLFDLLESRDGTGPELLLDTDQNGRVDSAVDANGDGLHDGLQTSTSSALAGLDSDGDGILNHVDTDSDNDGVSDLSEAGGQDMDQDGTVDGSGDADGDGVPDSVDVDLTGGDDADGDGIDDLADADFASGDDTDNDGIIDTRDDDANGDGVIDAIDAPALAAALPDADGDGIPDFRESGGSHAEGDLLQVGLGGSGFGCSVASSYRLSTPSRQVIMSRPGSDPLLVWMTTLAVVLLVRRRLRRNQDRSRHFDLAGVSVSGER